MSLLLPVIAKKRFTNNMFARVYMCPGDKSHSVVDLSFFLDTPITNQTANFVNVYLSDSNDLTKPKVDDIIFHRVPLGLPEVSPELSKIIVGKNQNLYIELIGLGPLNVRVSGLEEHNPLVTQAGSVARLTSPSIGVHELFKLDNPLTTFFNGTLIISNTTNTQDENIIFVSDNEDVKTITDNNALIHRVQKLFPKPGETVIIENFMLKPNERVYVSSKVKGVVFSLNGMTLNING